MEQRRSESGEQQAILDWCRRMEGKHPELHYLYHVPNEGRRSKAYGAKLKAEGMKAGVPDLCLPFPRGAYHGLYIELKVGRNTATKAQKEYIRYLNEAGYKAAVCYGFEEAIQTITAYLSPVEPGEPVTAERAREAGRTIKRYCQSRDGEDDCAGCPIWDICGTEPYTWNCERGKKAADDKQQEQMTL